MPDLRLPLAQARAHGLLPDLGPVRANIKDAAVWLQGELFESNPRIADTWRQHSAMNEAQRALDGVCYIDERVAAWEWLSLLLDEPQQLPWIVWAGREVDIGKTGMYIEQLIAMTGGNPDALVSDYLANPSPRLPVAWHYPFLLRIKNRYWDADVWRETRSWWLSDEGRADFNSRVFDFALRRLPELIALEEES
jgi:hypothetical protein